MNLNFGILSVVAMSLGLVACTHPDVKPQASDREVASVHGKRKIHVHAQSCKMAYDAGIKSPSRDVVEDATDVCTKAAEAACTSFVEQNSDGPETGDGRYVAADCQLKTSVGAYTAVAEHAKYKGTCKKAADKASSSPSRGDVDMANDLCDKEKEKACEAFVAAESDGPETGDGRMLASACELIGARGAYLAVAPRPKTVFNKCPGDQDHGSCRAWEDCCTQNYKGQKTCVPARCGD